MSKRQWQEDFRNPMYGLNKRGISAMKNDMRMQMAFSPYNTAASGSNNQAYGTSFNVPDIDLGLQETFPIYTPQDQELYFNFVPMNKVHKPNPQPNTNAWVPKGSSQHKLMPEEVPVPRPRVLGSNSIPVTTEQAQDYRSSLSSSNGIRSINPSLRVLSGGVDKTLQWMKTLGHLPILYEVMGKSNHFRTNTRGEETIFFLSDHDKSPTLQVSFFAIDRPLVIEPGSLLKVVGSVRGKFKLQAFSVLPVDQEELPGGKHIAYICDCAVKELKN